MTATITAPPIQSATVSDEVLTRVAGQAGAVDAGGVDPRPLLRDLLATGVFEPSVSALAAGSEATDIRESADVLADLAGECMTTAFAAWAQRMVLDFFARGTRSPRAEALFDELRRGERSGVTAMATGMKALAGLEPMAVQGRREGDRIVASGRITWASNLVPGAIIVLPVEIGATGDDEPERVVAFVPFDTPGVTARHITGLLALDGTASGMVTLTDVEIPAHAVLSSDFGGFARAFRPMFLLHQSALALGLARRSVQEAETRIAASPGHPLTGEVTAARTDLDHTWATWDRLASDLTAVDVRELLELRLHVALLAASTTRVESATAGGAGYLATSGPSRRLREAAFFPVQSPSEGQLRWEISSLDSAASA